EDSLCDKGQRMIDSISSHMEKYFNHKSLTESGEWKKIFSDLSSEIERLSSRNPTAAEGLYSVFFLVTDWADSAENLRKLSRSEDANRVGIMWTTAVERVKEKESSLRVICPHLKIPDYTKGRP
ncbi:MAG: hypothetical protein V1758_02405, partial [Pseudomonadota bacterium]